MKETIEEAFEKWSEEMPKGYDKLDVLRFGAKWQLKQHDFLPGLTKQFDLKEGEINGEEWTAVHFLKWLELNKFKIVK